MAEFEFPPSVRKPDWIDVHARARRQRARLLRVLVRRGWRHLRRQLRRRWRYPVPAPASRPAYEYWT